MLVLNACIHTAALVVDAEREGARCWCWCGGTGRKQVPVFALAPGQWVRLTRVEAGMPSPGVCKRVLPTRTKPATLLQTPCRSESYSPCLTLSSDLRHSACYSGSYVQMVGGRSRPVSLQSRSRPCRPHQADVLCAALRMAAPSHLDVCGVSRRIPADVIPDAQRPGADAGRGSLFLPGDLPAWPCRSRVTG